MLDIYHIARILGLTAFSFALALAWTPLLTHYLFKFKVGKQIRTEGVPVFAKMHKKKAGTPAMGGILIWATVIFIAVLVWLISRIFDFEFFNNLNFLTRKETLLPLGAFAASALVGFGDDLLGVLRIGPSGGGFSIKHRLVIYTFIAAFGAWWFFDKLDWDLIHIPFVGDFNIGMWYILLFVFIIVATAFSVNESDGLDGLSGGILMICFASYGVIAFSQGKMNLAAFCGVIIGALLAFLWFNIYPARFFMGDTGVMPLGITLGIIAMLTNTFLLLPLIAFIPFIESLSVIVQLTSKKLRGKKIFLSTPIHHHYEAKGWPETKVTMRFWILNGIAAAVALIIVFIDQILR